MYVKWMVISFSILVLIKYCHASADDYYKELVDIFQLKEPNVPSLNLIHNGNKSYYIGNIFKGNVLHGEQFCRYHGMNLVVIESQEENDFLEQKLLETGNTDEFFFTSATRIPSNKWVWLTNGKLIKYKNWNTGEPNNVVKEEQCIVVNTVNKQMKWYDAVCWNGYHFICEITWNKHDHKLLEILNKKIQCQNTQQLSDVRSSLPKTN